MNDLPLTEMLVWDLHRQFLELLMASLLITVVLLFVGMLILIFCLCWEEARAGRKIVRIEERVPLEAGAWADTPEVEQPAWNVEPALLGPESRVAA